MEKEIEETRKLMIEIAMSTGLGSRETLKISQKLDALINRYEGFQSKNDNLGKNR
ncbi:Spo0E family sporulation regulatory protein-aspartic acid phosphatase [Sporosarcina jiandibaonis]|uniref:Spo0E family sporulation regulatory protein-aspartic acid phosphatase n=1 Tax=Sporosarcina jiandibaonis TaxID=2715535 RepID=UPI00155750C1